MRATLAPACLLVNVSPPCHRYKAECAQGQKDVTLYKFLLTQPGRVIVFVNHVSSVRELCAMLQVCLALPATWRVVVNSLFFSFSCLMSQLVLCMLASSNGSV